MKKRDIDFINPRDSCFQTGVSVDEILSMFTLSSINREDFALGTFFV